MNRRIFVKGTSAALCLIPASRLRVFATNAPDTMPDWLVALVKRNDEGIINLEKYQITDVNHPDAGGARDATDLLNPHSTSAVIQSGACALYSPASKFYRSAELAKRMDLAVKYLIKTQHADGTIDLLSTNFHSTPDTGFLVKRLTMAYELIDQSQTKGKEVLLVNLKTFLLKAGDALTVGGIHTPNHRWVVSAALSKLNKLWPNPKYTARIDQWLGEHIDIDIDGQFNEKSTFIYSSLTDRLLVTIARNTNRPELLDAVRRNLDMTMYYVHPNGEIVTDASGRQDKAIIGTLENYYYPYRYLAIRDQSASYSAMCKLIEETAGNKIGGFLDYYLTDKDLWKPLPVAGKVPVEYVKTFPNSGLVRIRHNDRDSTLIAKNPVWFTFMKGNAVLQGVRFASSFFGKGQFQSETIEKSDDGWVLTQKLDGPYYQPIATDKISPDGDWEKMVRTERPQSEVQHLETKVYIRETENGMELRVSTSGTERVPCALELIFRPGGTLEGVEILEGTKDAWMLKKSEATFVSGKDRVTFGPGLALHKNIALRGALPKMDAPTVFLTGFTPFNHTIRFS